MDIRDRTVTFGGVIYRYDIDLNLVKTRLGCEIDLIDASPTYTGLNFFHDYKRWNQVVYIRNATDPKETIEILVTDEFLSVIKQGPIKHSDTNGVGFVFGPLFDTGYVPAGYAEADTIQVIDGDKDDDECLIYETELRGRHGGATVYIHLNKDSEIDSLIVDDDWVF